MMAEHRRNVAFGLGGISAQSLDHTRGGYKASLDGAIANAERAERAGFDGVWVTEHHFVDDGYLPSPLLLLSAIAQRTTAVRIGTQVLLAPLHNPFKLAEDVAVLDQLSGGRLALGIGLGYQGREYAAFGSSPERRVRDLVTCIATLRASAADQQIQVDGHSVSIRPLTFQTGGPPIWIGAIAEPGVRRSARLADGFVAPMMSLPGFKRRLSWLEDEGAPPHFTVGIYVHAFVAERDAWSKAAPGIAYVEEQYGRWQASHADFSRFQTIDRSDLSTPPEHVIVGTPSQVAEKLEPWVTTLNAFPGEGERQIIVRLTYPGVDPGAEADAIELFGREVVPALSRNPVPRTTPA